MDLVKLAQENLLIFQSGGYGTVDFSQELKAAVAGTRLYRPDDFPLCEDRSGQKHALEVTNESSGAAARRLAEDGASPLVLNFASAKNPGGGFLKGARAQEEDLARCSGLYPCLMAQPDYYRLNRAFGSPLYTDAMIYSPRVPFFRDERLRLLDRPFYASVLTVPAPNAGHADGLDVDGTLRRRARFLLQVAARHSERVLILGAWGCGVFRNDPVRVAAAFGAALDSCPPFEKVLFAVLDRTPLQLNLRAFEQQFGGVPSA